MDNHTDIVHIIYDYISNNATSFIVLLKNKEVIQWIFGDLSYLPITNCNTEQCKKLEDEWGRNVLKNKRPDLRLDKQWTNKFGEHIAEEIYTLCGYTINKPQNKNHYQPDLEIDCAIIETKTQTYYTHGTAAEKILGCPFKYAEIPDLYNKPLNIICIGGAEKICREQYGNLPGNKCGIQKKKFIEFFKSNQIEYIGATDILTQLVTRKE